MFNKDRWQEIFETIKKNKLRTFLSGFTVALGIFIFIILFGFGNGLKNSFKEFFLDDATNILYIESGKTSKPFKGYKASRRIEFENEDLYDIQKFFTGDIYSLGKKQKKITSHYDYLLREFNLPIQKLISWNGEDGVGVEGVLYLPHNFSESKKYPLVVQTHGGPRSSDKFGFSRSATRYNAVLTGKGYVVLQPNYRGSTGYGDDFLRDMVGSYFNQSHLDVMTGVDYLIDKGIADPDKLIKMGWSAGGHMTNKIITHTDRFKAASSGAGAVNWIGMYAQSDVRLNRTAWFGGTPWEKGAPIDVYWNNSPLKDIHKVKTPTLVLVGGSDPRVPPPQSIELFRALRSLSVETKLLIAPGEPHGWRKLSHRLTKINSELEWFAKYALDKKYEYEKYDQ